MIERVDLDEYLVDYPLEMQILSRKLRDLILEAEPEFDEVIRWKNLTYGQGKMLLAIVIHKNHLNLEFANGRSLVEKGYSLEGTGKNLRHLKIWKESDLESELIPELIKKSIEIDKNEG
ncbi:DUF1801 domain-containing protein [Methanobacterium sp. CWC-01]|uniref:DUF1801 domain-containing protein n=1 Tax=Methanobacterium aridiramus TaxID=2584467 RepID=UPI002577B53E|nr:DUF1801 domain-containing protein [Methanobacterium sp. CWC-01]